MAVRSTCIATIFSLGLTIAGCGGSSGDSGVIDPSTAANDAPAGEMDGGEMDVGGMDAQTEAGASSSSDLASTDSSCGAISPNVRYEVFSGDCQCLEFGRFVPSVWPGIIAWDGRNYCDINASTGVEPIDLLVPFSAVVPRIDGFSDFGDPDWDNAALSSWSSNKSDMTLISNLLTGQENGYIDGSRAASFGIMHDNTNLYLYVRVAAESSATGNPQIYLDSDNPSDDDSIELFIDGNNSKGSSYDGIDDFHVTLAYLDTTRTPEFGPNSASGLEVIFRTDQLENVFTGRYLYYEVVINMASAGIVVGQPFGFEVQLNEDDNGGPQDARFGWHEVSGRNEAAINPGVFGSLALTSCADPSGCGFDQSLTGE